MFVASRLEQVADLIAMSDATRRNEFAFPRAESLWVNSNTEKENGE